MLIFLRRATYGWAKPPSVRHSSALYIEFTSAHRNKQADHIKCVPRHHGMALSNIADGFKECSCKSVLRVFSIVLLQEPISRIIHELGYIKVFARWRRPFCSGLSQQIKPGSIILNRRKPVKEDRDFVEKNRVWRQTFSLKYVIF
jgi:hypothetical protein